MKTNANVIKLYKNKENFNISTIFLGPLMHLLIRPIILIFILKRKIKVNNARSMLCFTSIKSIDDVKMCKTKYLVYFIAIRSSVSNLLEENSIIDPFSM